MSEEQFQKITDKNDFKEGDLLRVKTKGKQIVSSIGEGKIYAIDEICTHVGDPLDVDIHDITLTLMLETEKFQMQQYGL